MPLNATEPAKTTRLVTIRKIRDFLVAREGIEPPTRGFSARCREFQGFIDQPLAATCQPLPRHTKAQSCHTQSEFVTLPSQLAFVDCEALRSTTTRQTPMAPLPRPCRLPKRKSVFRACAPLFAQSVRHAASHDRRRRQSSPASLAIFVE
jgi:hypothetical protein